MFQGYKVLITGATSGIGLATVKEFLAQGATVIGTGRDLEKMGDLGESFLPFHCDVTDETQIDAVVAYAEEKFGTLDTLILNAGAGGPAPIDAIEGAQLDYLYNLLLKANVLFVKKCLPLLRKSKNPSVAFTASVAGFMIDGTFPYNTLKASVINFCRQCVAQQHGIRFNVICPGLIHTNIMPEEAWASLSTEEALQQIPSRRIGRPEEPAKLFAFLASEKATFIDGAVITIDGGWAQTHARVLGGTA